MKNGRKYRKISCIIIIVMLISYLMLYYVVNKTVFYIFSHGYNFGFINRSFSLDYIHSVGIPFFNVKNNLENISLTKNKTNKKYSIDSSKDVIKTKNRCIFRDIAREIELPRNLDRAWTQIEKWCISRKIENSSYSPPCWTSYINEKKQQFCIADIFFIGFEKCGTGDIYKGIIQHGSIVTPGTKEPNFWADIGISFNNYLNNFKAYSEKINFGINPKSVKSIDAWPRTVSKSWKVWYDVKCKINYLPRFLIKLIPNIKIVVTVRNPVDLLWSAYHFRRRYSKKETNAFDFDIIVRQGITQFSNCLDTNTFEFCAIHIKLNLLANTFFSFHLSPWLQAIPREYFYFMKLEDYGKSKKKITRELYRFLQLDSSLDPVISSKQQNKKNSGAKKSSMQDATRLFLQKFYHPYNLQLSSLLNDSNYAYDDL